MTEQRALAYRVQTIACAAILLFFFASATGVVAERFAPTFASLSSILN